jgi:hypothetical protein
MVEENKEKFSPRNPENWDKFRTWAEDQNFFPDELKDVSSFQAAEEKITKLRSENESDKEYFENLYQLLQAVEQLDLLAEQEAKKEN